MLEKLEEIAATEQLFAEEFAHTVNVCMAA